MTRAPILIYGLAIAAGAFLLQWVEYRTLIRMGSAPAYGVAVALVFVALGIWIGRRVAKPTAHREFEINERALDSMGITSREVEVLGLLALGHSNREIASALILSTNTVKSHLASLYRKLEVSRRTQAVRKARTLRLIP